MRRRPSPPPRARAEPFILAFLPATHKRRRIRTSGHKIMSGALDSIIELLRSSDSKERRQGFSEAEAYLDSEEVDVAGAPDLVDALLPALSDSNPKFVQGALGLLIALVEVMGEDLASYVAGVWSPLVERLGDAKVANRERAVDLAVSLSTLVVGPEPRARQAPPRVGAQELARERVDPPMVWPAARAARVARRSWLRSQAAAADRLQAARGPRAAGARGGDDRRRADAPAYGRRDHQRATPRQPPADDP